MVTGMRGHIIWPFFSIRSHSLTPIYRLVLTQLPFFLIIHDKFFDNLSSNDPILTTFRQNFHFFSNFCQKCVQICILPGKIDQNFYLILTVWHPLSWSSRWMTPFSERNLSVNDPYKFSFKLLSLHPVTFEVECPPSYLFSMHYYLT